MKGRLVCSNRECSPLFPFTGTPLIRVQSQDITYNQDGTIFETTMYCGICKGHYAYEGNETIPDNCPKCKISTKWAIAKLWRMVCPKCG